MVCARVSPARSSRAGRLPMSMSSERLCKKRLAGLHIPVRRVTEV